MKIVVNKCYGGFELSDEAHEMLISLGIKCFKNWKELEKTEEKNWIVKTNSLFSNYASSFRSYDSRTNELLIQTVEKLKEKANGRCAKLKVIEIPDGTNYEIDDYDGIETIHEIHQSW